VADLDQVSFIDSAGLSALVGAAERAAAHGGSLHVVCARPQIRQLFRLTGLDRRLMPARTLHEALDALLAARSTPRWQAAETARTAGPGPGGEDHEATRSGKGGSRLLARSRLPPPGWAMP
jgi:hypothetical protein